MEENKEIKSTQSEEKQSVKIQVEEDATVGEDFQEDDDDEVKTELTTSKTTTTTTTAKTTADNDVVLIVEDDVDGRRKQTNSYAAKKTVAQGMMDIALITANANQLRYIVEFNKESSTYLVTLFLIILSLILQVAVGVSLIFKGRMDLKGQSKHQNAKKINNYVVVGIFMVTIINVFIASFTIT